jgi:hypothetical protein
MTETAYVPQQSNDDAEHDGGYPPYVVMLEEKRRWDLCLIRNGGCTHRSQTCHRRVRSP